MFHQPGPNLARLIKHFGESNEQLKSFEKDKEIKPAALSHAVSEIKAGSTQSTAPNPFLLFSQAGATHLPEVTLGPLTASKAHPVGSSGSDSAAPVIALSQLLVNNPDNLVKNALMTAPAAPEQGAKGDAIVATAHALDHHGSKVESNQTLVAALKSDSPKTTSTTPVARVDSTPVLVAATKLDSTVPVTAAPDLRAETAPTLVAATKLDSPAPAAPTPGAKVEAAPTLVAAAKVEPATKPNHGEVNLSKTNPASQAMASETRVEPGSVQLVAANPFMAIKQVAVRDEAVVDGSGKVVVNAPVVSFLPAVVARVAPESSIAIALTANSHTDKALADNIHATTPLAATATYGARLAGDNGDSNSRPPVVVAGQLMVKDPASRNEVSTPAQPALLHAPGNESTAPAHAPVNRLDNPALVAATKLEAQSPIAQSPTSRLDNPVLVAATN
ncbi:MAG: hypothetical protein IPL73_24845 [Candidatus Obscuribacter sp.]|nr:hypothetical protein [Candidatus Obscuribacter sp.]